ncbi:MAG: SMC-Scp complex subunit ScpB [Myxococcales bacterium]|nr:SMC-Scp complex subunit ScpB [Myxococcales bacterium]MCB9523356.1 SMC-Scp complex subunit ScpB [Myxococcales bacterium]
MAADTPLSAAALADLLARAAAEEEWDGPTDEPTVSTTLAALAQASLDGHLGIELVQVAQGWRIRTAPDLGVLVRRLWPERALRLSRAALETLAVVAYRQPCTRAEIEAVRGVDCGGIVRTLMDRDLLRIIGRKDEPGRPLLYGTTPTFLETFSLEDLRHLPTLRDLDALRAEEASLATGARGLDADDEPAPPES